MDFPYLPAQNIDSAAVNLLAAAFEDQNKIGQKVDLNVVVFDHLVEREGMYFSDEVDLGYEDGEKVIGKMFPLAGKVLVCHTVRADGPEGRYRFTVGHEIGHWVLHRPLFLAQREARDLFGQRHGLDAVTSLNRNVFPSGGSRPPAEEWQANRFAVALLVDPDLLRTEFEVRFRETPIVCSSGDLHAVARDVAREEVDGRRPLGDEFGLSAEAMAFALESQGYVTDRPPIL